METSDDFLNDLKEDVNKNNSKSFQLMEEAF